MAKVQVQVVGGDITQKEANTVAELQSALGLQSHQATVNGEPVDNSYELDDYEFVAFSPKVKGNKWVADWVLRKQERMFARYR